MDEKILERLKKLIRHQQSAENISSQHEANVFADKIQEILDEYNLSLSDVDISEKGINIDQELSNRCFKREWKRHLLIKIAKINSCECVYDKPRMIIIGVEDDRKISFQLFDYFADLGDHLYALKTKEIREQGRIVVSKYKGSFMWGYAMTIANRLYARHQKSLEHIEQTSTALVYIGDKLAKANEFVDNNIGTKKYKIRANIGSYSGFESGKAAGNSVALTDETFEDKKRRQLNG